MFTTEKDWKPNHRVLSRSVHIKFMLNKPRSRAVNLFFKSIQVPVLGVTRYKSNALL